MDVEGQDRCSIADLSSGPRPTQKFMTNRIADRVMYLERQMMGFTEALDQAHAILATSSLSVPCQVRCYILPSFPLLPVFPALTVPSRAPVISGLRSMGAFLARIWCRCADGLCSIQALADTLPKGWPRHAHNPEPESG